LQALMTRIRYIGDPRRDFLEPLASTRALPSSISLIGPLPLFAVVRAALPRQIGWSVLALDGPRPLAMVDAGWTRGRRRFHAVHSEAAAAALHDALQQMRRLVPRPGDLRLLTTRYWRDTCVAGPRHRSLVVPLYDRGRRRRPVPFDTWYAIVVRKRERNIQIGAPE
jgi:hypothetical protein